MFEVWKKSPREVTNWSSVFLLASLSSSKRDTNSKKVEPHNYKRVVAWKTREPVQFSGMVGNGPSAFWE